MTKTYLWGKMESWCFGGNFLWGEAPSIGRRRKPLCLINTRLYKSIQKKLLLLLWGYTCSKIFFWLYRGLPKSALWSTWSKNVTKSCEIFVDKSSRQRCKWWSITYGFFCTLDTWVWEARWPISSYFLWEVTGSLNFWRIF